MLGDIGFSLNKSLSELASMSVDEYDFWTAYIQVRHGNEQSPN